MNRKNKSIIFWIIFLVIVALIALMIFPKYGTLSKRLRVAQARNIAATLTSSSATNYTLRKADASKGFSLTNCQDLKKIGGNLIPPGYEITNQVIQPDKVAVCTLTVPGGTAIQFSVAGIN